MKKNGKITQIIGAVVDVNFNTDLPEIYTALEANNSGNKVNPRSCSTLRGKRGKDHCDGCY